MEGLSLEDLQAQLQAVQHKKSTVRLSERNVVELVNKLKELGLLGNELLHTSNGLEYITRNQLRKEIEAALSRVGGRLALSDLPGMLGVDFIHCEHESEEIISQAKGTVTSVQGDLITNNYFESVGVEINEMLKESGMVRIGDLAIHFTLSTEMILSIISSNLGSVIDGRLAENMLYTPLYVARVKAQLRGALRGVTLPSPITSIAKTLKLDGSGVGAIVTTLVDELVHEGAVKGSIKSGGMWVPDTYQRAQQDAVKSFYSQNGWVALDALQRAGIPVDRASVEEAIPGGTLLDSKIVSPGVLAQADMGFQEVAGSGTWCSVASLVPSSLTTEDIAKLMLKFPNVKTPENVEAGSCSTLLLLAGTCVTSMSLVEDAQLRAVEDARSLAQEALKKSTRDPAEVSTSGSHQQGKSSQAGSQAADEINDDDWDTGKGKGKKKGKTKAKGKGKLPSGKNSGGSSIKKPPDTSLVPSPENLANKLVEWYPFLEDGSDCSKFLLALAKHICPAAVSEYHASVQVAMSETSAGRRHFKEVAFKSFEEEMQHLWTYMRGAKLLEQDKATYSMLQKQLVKSSGANAVDWLLRFIQLHDPNAEVPEPLVPIPHGERSKIVKQLPPEVSKNAQVAVEAIGGADPQAVFEAAERAGEAFSVRLKKMDKKLERQIVTELKVCLKEQLRRDVTPPTCLSLVLPLIFAQVYGRAVSIPGKAIAGVLSNMKEDVKEESYLRLDEFHKLVVASLKTRPGAPPAEDYAAVLQEKMIGIKAIAGVGDKDSCPSLGS